MGSCASGFNFQFGPVSGSSRPIAGAPALGALKNTIPVLSKGTWQRCVMQLLSTGLPDSVVGPRSPSEVFGSSNWFKVGGINARSDSTKMIQVKFPWIRDVELVKSSVGQGGTKLGSTQTAVTIGILSPAPQPTSSLIDRVVVEPGTPIHSCSLGEVRE